MTATGKKLKPSVKAFMLKKKKLLKKEGYSEARIESWRRGFLNEAFNTTKKKG
tara:strand:+ start:776 stop:934 length:159 start_codon:yes stop_codon:yes gene_type:complete